MANLKNQVTALSLSLASLALSILPASCANSKNVYHSDRNYYQGAVRRQPVTMREYFQDHPKIKAATMGAGVGVAAGALTGLVTNRGILKGALIGAGTGAGVGLIRSSEIMKRHPIVKNVATGTAVGGGLGLAAGGHGRRWTDKGLAVGAALGLGAGLLSNGI